MRTYHLSVSSSTEFAMASGWRRRCRMSPRQCLGFGLLTVTALILAVVAPVAAVPPTREELPLPEGTVIPVPDVCPFDLEILVLTSGETLTTFFDQGGNVVMQLTTGPLKVRITNVETGESIDRNISGPGRILDKGTTSIMTGPWLIFVPELGIVWLTTGRVVAEIDPATGFIVSFRSITGTVQDICEALAS
jgi:hypothetical protein